MRTFTTTCTATLVLAGLAVSLAPACGRTDLSGGAGDAGVPGVDSALTIDATPDHAVADVSSPLDVYRVDVNPLDAIVVKDAVVHQPDSTPIDSGHDASPCGNGKCDNGETCSSCPLDCGWCATCGNGTCDQGETCSSCPQDCGYCATCPDGFCDDGETCATCPQDCGVCPTCGDGKCNGTENCSNCPADCGACSGCGDGVCSPGETCISCPADCGSCAYCGNGVCEASEGETCNSCPKDCGACPIAETCSQILTCAIGCFSGSIASISLSCITDCDANSCTQAYEMANNATSCMLQAALTGKCGTGGGGGVGSILTCLEQACSTQISACMNEGSCPGTTGSGG